MSKIYYNLLDSPYKFTFDDYDFIFSSQFYLDSFHKKYENYLLKEKEKLEYRFSENIDCNIILLIDLYKKVEKRGFLIKYKNEELKIKDYLFTVQLND